MSSFITRPSAAVVMPSFVSAEGHWGYIETRPVPVMVRPSCRRACCDRRQFFAAISRRYLASSKVAIVPRPTDGCTRSPELEVCSRPDHCEVRGERVTRMMPCPGRKS